jgi:hypothetical protein
LPHAAAKAAPNPPMRNGKVRTASELTAGEIDVAVLPQLDGNALQPCAMLQGGLVQMHYVT